MIAGRVTNREAIVELDLAGPGQSLRSVEAVIDTGYNGQLTLPRPLVSRLNLPFAGHRRGRLADGSIAVLDVYLATVV
jgi:predicted aspartyl protease